MNLFVDEDCITLSLVMRLHREIVRYYEPAKGSGDAVKREVSPGKFRKTARMGAARYPKLMSESRNE